MSLARKTFGFNASGFRRFKSFIRRIKVGKWIYTFRIFRCKTALRWRVFCNEEKNSCSKYRLSHMCRYVTNVSAHTSNGVTFFNTWHTLVFPMSVSSYMHVFIRFQLHLQWDTTSAQNLWSYTNFSSKRSKWCKTDQWKQNRGQNCKTAELKKKPTRVTLLCSKVSPLLCIHKGSTQCEIAWVSL